eukprot:CAMPEP_0201682120 /NCGR_PEP_ID=MMETSP0494-20130426/51459_1 /ASSEMBLY_ACC=CAM_ASM_000839 /TAXON_ID=420259 /ORGANISM="Thalassiosira gravida, Strain GMp14c1" /LENGTH=592 /DNA_ID=CAMNT_0048165877 /DNA_START=2592 /DNA_END=4370 /DNA_ORIENTATION=-
MSNFSYPDLDPLGTGFDISPGDGDDQQGYTVTTLSAIFERASNEMYLSAAAAAAGYDVHGGIRYLNLPSTRSMEHSFLASPSEPYSAALMPPQLHNRPPTSNMEQFLLATQIGRRLVSNESYSAAPVMPPHRHHRHNNHSILHGYGGHLPPPDSLSILSRSYPTILRNTPQTARYVRESATAPMPTPQNQIGWANANNLVATRSFSTACAFGKQDIIPTVRPSSNNPRRLSGSASISADQDQQKQPVTHTSSRLSIKSDQTFLDPVHNFLRRHCIELFIASEEDMTTSGRGARSMKIGQIGLRCYFCKDEPKHKLTKQAICFPSKRDTIFESVRNYQRTHLPICPCIPEEIKAKYMRLTEQNLRQKRSQKFLKAYYAEAASELGIVDSPSGLVLGARPNGHGVPSKKIQALIHAADNPATSSAFWKAYSTGKDKAIEMRKFEHIASDTTKRIIINARKESTPFVHPEDFPTISDFDFILFHQIAPPCTPPLKKYDETDKKFEFCCKHCAHAGEGVDRHKDMYFLVNLNVLTEKNFYKKLLHHFMTCPNVPQEVKNAFDELKRLSKEYGTIAKRGSRKRFIEKIWERMKKYYG